MGTRCSLNPATSLSGQGGMPPPRLIVTGLWESRREVSKIMRLGNIQEIHMFTSTITCTRDLFVVTEVENTSSLQRYRSLYVCISAFASLLHFLGRGLSVGLGGRRLTEWNKNSCMVGSSVLFLGDHSINTASEPHCLTG